jgi:hypothetical protein
MVSWTMTLRKVNDSIALVVEEHIACVVIHMSDGALSPG